MLLVRRTTLVRGAGLTCRGSLHRVCQPRLSSVLASTPDKLPQPQPPAKPHTAAAERGAAAEAPAGAAEAPVVPEQRSLRAVIAQYGLLALVFHESVWATCWCGLYVAVQSGIDIPGLLASIPDWVPGASKLATIDPTAGALATSYVLVTCTGPVRLGFTISCMPFVARRWDRWRSEGGGGVRGRAAAAVVALTYVALLGTAASKMVNGS
jgi:hypothetical protein